NSSSWRTRTARAQQTLEKSGNSGTAAPQCGFIRVPVAHLETDGSWDNNKRVENWETKLLLRERNGGPAIGKRTSRCSTF
ncbi:MAG TPA: hypothetical protein P5560_11535, partial [Thermotogota bacterium]|nr:hypothetical protein [Thermotogota bacterium]HRW93572.1 hypothetical protein [Thermotogota bacterium]